MPKAIEELQLELKDSIEALECLEVVAVSSRDGDIRLLCRCTDQGRWMEAMFLYLMKEYGWYSFIGKKYFAKDNRLRFGWVLMFAADDMEQLVKDVRSIIHDIIERLDHGDMKTDPVDDKEVMDKPTPQFPPGMRDKMTRRVQPLRP